MISSGVRRRYKINTDSLDAHQFIKLEKKYEEDLKPPSVITQEQTRKACTKGAVSSNGSEYYWASVEERRVRRANRGRTPKQIQEKNNRYKGENK